MSDIPKLVRQLKLLLRQNELTYQDVAQQLSLSEASVKRLFAQQHFTLERLEQICNLVGVTFYELVTEAERSREKVGELSLEQEQQIVSDIRCLLITYLVLNRWTFDEILDNYTFSEHELIQLLAQLDRMKIIELLPRNAIRLRTAPDFRWIEGGPIETFVLKRVKDEFLNAPFNQEEDTMRLVSGLLSSSTYHQMQQKLAKLEEEIHLLLQKDAKLPASQRRGFSLLFASRYWDLEEFARFKKPCSGRE
ncbi:helix-turn-helix transcriptional regulator [Pleionea sp. CnH1-48]|uniref:helix-turn-helix domain-containing protein n=1 Tax=Pleionea sp. CnH1-48 TaxID=2954494 RepID=UPI0020969DDA|nr:helix-turn-helix transcriptional regulator [Pleionea sp. CnH1-48]MCO7224647.1 helix-turn-helix transcriptional regulator [Pleionea sp. CnH1-48]